MTADKEVTTQICLAHDLLKAIDYKGNWGMAKDAMAKVLEQYWQCFFCSRSFTDRELAKEHFGTRSYDPPLCLADLQELLTLRGQRDALQADLKSLRGEHHV